MIPANKVDFIASNGSIASITSKKRQKSLTPPLVQMELIKPSKYKVKVMTMAIENTLSKKMRVTEAES